MFLPACNHLIREVGRGKAPQSTAGVDTSAGPAAAASQDPGLDAPAVAPQGVATQLSQQQGGEIVEEGEGRGQQRDGAAASAADLGGGAEMGIAGAAAVTGFGEGGGGAPNAVDAMEVDEQEEQEEGESVIGIGPAFWLW